MSPGTTFERVYRALKEQLGSRRFRPGDHLEPGILSYELNSSITPVRDALHRLVGERLVASPRGDGFRTPAVTEVGLRYLYGWNRMLLNLAARAAPAGEDRDASPTEHNDPVEAVEQIFARIAARSGNPEHLDAVLRLSDRLRPVRKIEPELLVDLALELTQLEEIARQGNPSVLRRSLIAYHRRRERMAGQIVAKLQRAS